MPQDALYGLEACGTSLGEALFLGGGLVDIGSHRGIQNRSERHSDSLAAT